MTVIVSNETSAAINLDYDTSASEDKKLSSTSKRRCVHEKGGEIQANVKMRKSVFIVTAVVCHVDTPYSDALKQ